MQFFAFESSGSLLKRSVTFLVSVNETCGERSYKTASAFAVNGECGCISLVIFRMTSLRLPVFEISAIVHPFYCQPAHAHFRCKVTVSCQK